MALPRPSSTFSSRRRLALIAGPALVLLLAYHVLTSLGAVPASGGLQFSERNRIRCEAYVHHPSLRPEVVFLGSSLTENLPVEALSDRIYNLGLGANSTWTGLEVVRSRTAFRPSILVIEIGDLLLRPANPETLGSLLNPFARAVHEKVPMLRTEYQPLLVAMKVVNRLKARPPEPAGPQPSSSEAAINPEVTARFMAAARLARQSPPDDGELERLRAVCAELRAAVAEFEKAGTRCILQRIPGEASLDQTPRIVVLDALFTEEFPDTGFTWVPPMPGFISHTRDSTHMVDADAAAYARYVCQFVLPAK